MSWSVSEVRRMSGVTSRTLRHYHHIGLLEPEDVDPGGRRRYGRRELRRLQRILLLRELGLGLAEIRRVLDDERDEVTALRGHLSTLEAERGRLDTLIETVRRTVDALEGDDVNAIRPEELFEGFDTDRYEERARSTWPEQWERARAATEEMSPEEADRMRAEAVERMERMAVHLRAGTPVDDPAVRAEVADLHRGLTRMWTPDAAAFAHLGRVYAEEGPWREVHEKVAPGLADYQRAAMEDYARHVLAEEGER